MNGVKGESQIMQSKITDTTPRYAPPLPYDGRGVPCGQEAHPCPPKGRGCHADSSYMTLKHVYSAQQLPSHRRGGVRGGVSNFSTSPFCRICNPAALSLRICDSLQGHWRKDTDTRALAQGHWRKPTKKQAVPLMGRAYLSERATSRSG